MTNKEIVLDFYEKVFKTGDLTNLEHYMKEDYIQHNPEAATGREGFRAFAEMFCAQKPEFDIRLIAEDGDLVFVFFKCTIHGGINKVCDIYRLEDGKLAEHWDAVQHMPEDTVYNNDNGLF